LYVEKFTIEGTGNVTYFEAQDIKLNFEFALQHIFNLAGLIYRYISTCLTIK